MEVTPYEVLHWLYGMQRKAKQAKGRAEYRPGVTQEELDNLEKKIAFIEYLIVKVWKEI